MRAQTRSPIRFKFPTVSLIGLGTTLLVLRAMATPIVYINGDPSAPTMVGMGSSYDITVGVTATLGNNVTSCSLYAASGNSQSPTSTFVLKWTHNFSGLSTAGAHTWTVANQASGYYWWKGKGNDDVPSLDFSADYGYYWTM